MVALTLDLLSAYVGNDVRLNQAVEVRSTSCLLCERKLIYKRIGFAIDSEKKYVTIK